MTIVNDPDVLVLTLLDLATATTWQTAHESARFLNLDIPTENLDAARAMAWHLIDNFLSKEPALSMATVARLFQTARKHFGQ